MASRKKSKPKGICRAIALPVSCATDEAGKRRPWLAVAESLMAAWRNATDLLPRWLRRLSRWLLPRRPHPCLKHAGRPQVGRYAVCPGWRVEPLTRSLWVLWHDEEPVQFSPPALDYLSRLEFRQKN